MYNCYFVFGTSKLNLYAVVPMLLDYTSGFILVVTGNNKFENVSTISSNYSRYDVLSSEMGDDDINDFISKMKSKQIRVGVINSSHPLFNQVLKISNGSIWFSACRERIFEYLSHLKNYTDLPTQIFCFDNDENMINKAKIQFEKYNIEVIQCVAHSICSHMSPPNDGKIILSGGNECFLFFSPKAKFFANHLEYPIISKWEQLRFSNTDAEFSFYPRAKIVNINAIHTFLCIMAYVEGYQNNISLRNISTMCFSELIDQKYTIDVISNLHSLLFEKHLKPYVQISGNDQILNITVTTSFIKYLFSHNEIVGRGLNKDDSSYFAKLKRHLPILESVNDPKTNEYINKFNNIVNNW